MTEWYTKKMILEQCYQELTACRDLWIQYRNALEIYPDILKIRKKFYKRYSRSSYFTKEDSI